MQKADEIMKIVHSNNGVISSGQLTSLGIHRYYLRRLVDKGILERTARGIYALPNVLEDEFLTLQTKYKRGIFSNNTALYLHGLTDRTPDRFEMTFPLNYNTSQLPADSVVFYRVKNEWYSLGIVSVKTPSGNTVSAYSIERSLCEILKGRSNVGIEIISAAYKQWAGNKKKDLQSLSKYAKIFRVEKKVTSYLEVLL
jgi:predicted transcriptional regulator of viral defense system